MVTSQGYDSVEDFTKKRLEKQEEVEGNPSFVAGDRGHAWRQITGVGS